VNLTNAERQEVKEKVNRMDAIKYDFLRAAAAYIGFLAIAFLLPPHFPLSTSAHYAVTGIAIVIGTLTVLITIGPRVIQRLREYFELGARVRELAEKSL
tara:strand:+ start:5998 stop:6294 length:297 start_codon:yes stop_codon:yes gene_type:complete